MTNRIPNHFERTFRSKSIRGGCVTLEYCVEYWQNELLRVCLGKEVLDELNREQVNKYIMEGKPWILYRTDLGGTTRMKGFKSFRNAVDYLITNQPKMSEDSTYLPDGEEVIDEWGM